MFTQNITATQKTLSVLKGTEKKSIAQGGDVKKAIQDAISRVAPIWPLANFIAVNPLQGFESEKFQEAVDVARKLFHGKGLPEFSYFHQQFKKGRITSENLKAAIQKIQPQVSFEELTQVLVEEAHSSLQEVFLTLSEWADQLKGTKLYPTMQAEISKWCSAYFDRGEAAWEMPGREHGFFRAWKDLAIFDRSMDQAGAQGFRDYVEQLPNESEEAIEQMLSDLGVPLLHVQDYLQRHLAASPGWSGLFAFYGSEQNFFEGKKKTASLTDFLAVRLVYDTVGALNTLADEWTRTTAWEGMLQLAKKELPGENAPSPQSATAGMIWLEAFEKNYRDQLLNQLACSSKKVHEISKAQRPQAQAVFCIDVRSEAFRRNLEKQGNFDTYGFAGFFAIPLAYQEFGAQSPSSQCPVLIRPKYLIKEQPEKGNYELARKLLVKKDSEKSLKESLQEVKNTSVSPFAFVEACGGLGFLSMYRNSFAPKREAQENKVITRPELEVRSGAGIPIEDQIAVAENSLKIMGLQKNFGRLVLLCGHGSTTTNNAYATALDCGACGGHRGAPNARVAVQIFNNQRVRNALALKGIIIPSDTVFIAGEHNTATDSVSLYDTDLIPESHLEDVKNLEAALLKAKEGLNIERTQRFDNPQRDAKRAVQEVERRSLDWSEVRPEWGLAGNAAFIVAKRSLTQHLDLKSRTFLHSYDWESDSQGSALEVIMTAPMVVAEWINTQYYFSSVDNEVFGSGNKVIHNVVGKLGVMQGNVSDLKIGLPLQSVSNGTDLIHEPMRLLVVIEAPKERIQAIVEKHASVRKLVVNEWIRLVAFDPQEKLFFSYSPQGGWAQEEVALT